MMRIHIAVAVAALTLLTAGCATAPQARTFPTINRPVSGIFLETGRDLLPQGLELRAVLSEGVALTKASEGWVPELYNDPAGFCTIGYGHLVKRAVCDGGEPPEFLDGLTEEEGEALLIDDMTPAQIVVMNSVTVELTDAQFSALTDFVFNVGSGNFRNSTLLRKINGGDHEAVPTQLRRWVYADGQTYPGLVTRREREIELYFLGEDVPRVLPGADEDTSPIDIRAGESED